MRPAKAFGRHHTLEAPHRPFSLFDSFMLQMIIFVTRTPEHYETDDIGAVLPVIEARAGPLIELLLASPTPKPPVAQLGVFSPLP